MNKKRPIIAITHSINQSRAVIFFIKLAVWLAGGKPLCITINKNSTNYNYHGLILYGGVDINPKLYKKAPKPGYKYENERDTLELNHLALAEKKGLPVLGICRGCQLMNIYRKGDLHLDIIKAYEATKYPSNFIGFIFFRKKIYIKKNSKLFSILGRKTVKVNSIHRQSINQLGENLLITASEKNQIVQCIEDPIKPFYLGVQFHPEFLIHRSRFRNIFKSFIKVALKKHILTRL